MRLSVIVPAYNEEKLIGATLESVNSALRALAQHGWETESIVCDNNSTDRTAEFARAAGARVVFEPFNQISRARNKGAEVATGDWLVFVDADSQPSTGLFEEVASRIEGGRVLAGGCTVEFIGASSVGALGVRVWNCFSRVFKLLAGSFIFCEAAAFREVAGFSAELFAGEELELSAKLKKAARQRGKKIVILHRFPLVTSGRKLYLYRLGEHLRFLLNATIRPRAVLGNRNACHTWYDGRR